jgi:hypothetical protein
VRFFGSIGYHPYEGMYDHVVAKEPIAVNFGGYALPKVQRRIRRPSAQTGGRNARPLPSFRLPHTGPDLRRFCRAVTGINRLHENRGLA